MVENSCGEAGIGAHGLFSPLQGLFEKLFGSTYIANLHVQHPKSFVSTQDNCEPRFRLVEISLKSSYIT